MWPWCGNTSGTFGLQMMSSLPIIAYRQSRRKYSVNSSITRCRAVLDRRQSLVCTSALSLINANQSYIRYMPISSKCPAQLNSGHRMLDYPAAAMEEKFEGWVLCGPGGPQNTHWTVCSSIDYPSLQYSARLPYSVHFRCILDKYPSQSKVWPTVWQKRPSRWPYRRNRK